MLTCREPEVGCLYPQRRIVRHHARRGDLGLSESSPDDPVVRHGRVKPVVLEAVVIHMVYLDMQGSRIGVVRQRGGFGK